MSSVDSDAIDYDVVVVGGGPAGAAAAVFTARYGLETVVFDRGNAALARCAFLENYLGFPAGIDIDTYYALAHAHVEENGGELVPETVTTVDRRDAETFVVETQDGTTVTTDYVIAAAWYDGEFLRPLDGDAMFTEHEHGEDTYEGFDPEYADETGRTPVDGLYVASPAGRRSAQAIVAAGHGAHVARSLLEDHRLERDYPEGVATRYDWLRRDAEFAGEWADRDRWREWFEEQAPSDHDVPEDRFRDRQERYVEDVFDRRLTEDEAETRAREGIGRLVDVIGTDRVLDAIDDETLQEYLQASASDDGR
ncbi:FAD-dependent oxidoreductase [Halopiger goleimassiliensis]|uniref:FAD-dependent oxidoreductase n=1 Tax=Halopiger goleimassiliensis TaxID=1293048 RepID=UPI000677D233|nr:FAD-dependent oxidoreductase [Halopiger goleimassiliensis]